MLSKIKAKYKSNKENFALIFIIILTICFASYYNVTQQKIKNNYNELLNNIFFKKTANHFFDKLEPKFKKIKHNITPGETFDNILGLYLNDKVEINNLKNKISEIIDLNKLNTNQKINLTIDQSTNKIKNFTFQISTKEKIVLSRNENNNFNKEIILTKLEKKIIYQENIILQSLYKSATDKNIPANTVIEFITSVFKFSGSPMKLAL